jgi:hypothetical protein
VETSHRPAGSWKNIGAKKQCARQNRAHCSVSVREQGQRISNHIAFNNGLVRQSGRVTRCALVQAAQQPDQDQDRQRNAEQPKQ